MKFIMPQYSQYYDIEQQQSTHTSISADKQNYNDPMY